MSLFAPLAVPVEIRAETRADARPGDSRRVFRLSTNVAESGLILERPAPFEIDQPVTVGFTLPDATFATTLALRAVVALTDGDGDGEDGGRAIHFLGPLREDREAITRYVAGRLGLPGAPRQ